MLYNELGQNRTEYIRLPVPAVRKHSRSIFYTHIWQTSEVTVTDYNGNHVATSFLPVPFNASITTAVFEAYMPAAGYSTYFLVFGPSAENMPQSQTKVCLFHQVKTSIALCFQAGEQSINNAFYKLSFDSSTGRLSNIANLVSGVSTNVCSMKDTLIASFITVPPD